MSQITLTGTPVRNATPKPKEDKPKPQATKRQGTVYVSNGGWHYEEPQYTPEQLKKYAESYYGSSILLKLNNLIVSGAPEIKAIGPDGNEDEQASEALMALAESPTIRLYEKMRFAFYDLTWAGFACFNDVWDYDGPEYTLKELRRLPPEGFRNTTISADYTDPIFQGIVVVNDELKWYQTNDTDTIQIINPFYLQAPLSRNIAGTALIKALIPVIAFLQQSIHAMQQTIDRTGAPWMFIRVNDEYSDDDLAYVDKMLAGWGKDTSFKLLPNMEVVVPPLPEPKTPVEAINMLTRMLIEYFSPASFIQNDNAALSSSDVSSLRLFNQWIIGMQTHIEDAFERLLQPYLDGNLYRDYHVEITLPRPQEDRTELLLKVLDGINKAGIARDEELRAILPEYTPELTDEEMMQFREERKARQPAQAVNPFMQQAQEPGLVTNARLVQMLEESLKV